MEPIEVWLSMRDPLMLVQSAKLAKLREGGIPVDDLGNVPHGDLSVQQDVNSDSQVYRWTPRLAVVSPAAPAPAPIKFRGDYTSLKTMIEAALRDHGDAHDAIIMVFPPNGDARSYYYADPQQLAYASVRFGCLAMEMVERNREE